MVDQEPKSKHRNRNSLIDIQTQLRDIDGDRGVCIYPPKKPEKPEEEAEKPLFRRVDCKTLNEERAEFYADLTKKTAACVIDTRTAHRKVEQYHYLKPIPLMFGYALNPKWRKPENAPHSHHY